VWEAGIISNPQKAAGANIVTTHRDKIVLAAAEIYRIVRSIHLPGRQAHFNLRALFLKCQKDRGVAVGPAAFIQELIVDGCRGVTKYKPEGDKIMRLHAQTTAIENGFVFVPEAAPWLAAYLHEMTVFPKGKHDDQVDSTAQFLDWFKKPYPGQGIFEYYRMEFEKLQRQRETSETWARLRAPPGIGAVQTFSGRHLDIDPDGTVEMSADDAEFLISDGWTKIAEWTNEAAA
jgi:predicted phage terminase large subunit-like protein